MVSILRSALAAVAACAVLTPVQAGAQRDAGVVRAGELWFEELPAQHLDAGRCGLFLWTRQAEPVFVLVAYDVPDSAYVRANGRERMLRRTAFEGERVHGQFERQTFSDGRLSLEVDVQFDLERPIRDGAVVQEGVIRAVDEGGWQTVIPVGGLVACQVA
ncbi:MAG: hypothetical protein AB7P07_13290 [Hyphomonadaceae bacterium]